MIVRHHSWAGKSKDTAIDREKVPAMRGHDRQKAGTSSIKTNKGTKKVSEKKTR
jgi:hypothetical protein